MKMKSILDRSFRYTNSAETDLRKTFAKLRREQRKEVQKNAEAGSGANVVPIPRRAAPTRS